MNSATTIATTNYVLYAESGNSYFGGEVTTNRSGSGTAFTAQIDGATVFYVNGVTGTNYKYGEFLSGGSVNNLRMGIEQSGGGALFNGSSSYASVIGNNNAYPLEFATNGTVRMKILADGKVGIAVGTPTSLFHTKGSASNQAHFEANTSTNSCYNFISNGGGSLYYGVDSSAGNYSFSGTSAYGSFIGSGGAVDFHMGVSNTVKMTIVGSSGNVEIGSDSTASGSPVLSILKGHSSGTSVSGLSVSPLATASITTEFIGAIINPQVSWAGTQAQVKSLWIAPQFGSSNTITNYYGLYIQDSATGNVTNGWSIYSTSTEDSYFAGRIGIGETTPDSQLHILHSGSGTSSGIRLENSSGRNWLIGEVTSNSRFTIYDVGASDGRFNINSSGDVGIGSSTPAQRLQVTKNDSTANIFIGKFEQSKNNATSASGILALNFSSVTPNDGNHVFLWCEDSTNSKAYIASNGDYYSRSGNYNTISDARLKGGIKKARSYWHDFSRIEYVKYYMLDNPSVTLFGNVAQQVGQIFPSLIVNTPEGYYGVKDQVIFKIGMSVLQENMKRTMKLEQRMIEKQTQIDKLNDRINRLEKEVSLLKAA